MTISATANRERWQTTRERNPLSQRMATAHEHLVNVALGHETGTTLFVGSPGVGKTHEVEAVCKAHDRGYMRIQSCTDLKLLDYLERCSNYNLLAIVDDADAIWTTKKSVQMLLEITKPRDDRGRRRYTHGSARNERTYNLDRTQIIFLSNTDVTNVRSFSPSVRPAMGAMVDRSSVISVHAEDEHIYNHACALAILDGIFARYPLEVQNDALRWFALNRFRVASPTIRTLTKVMRKRSMYPDTWERHLAMEERLDSEAPEMHLHEDDVPRVIPILRAAA